MASISAQTVRLRRGRHARPEEGACVVELASMLAGERFSDHPRCVSGVVAAFLRGYNDGIGDGARQDLYPLASELVDSAGSSEIEAARLRRCRIWARPLYRRGWLWRWRTSERKTSWVERTGFRTAIAARDDKTGYLHQATLRFASELIAVADPVERHAADAAIPLSGPRRPVAH